MEKEELLKKLTVGTKIEFGKKYCKFYEIPQDKKPITLVEGIFEIDNGLYTYFKTCPSVYVEETNDYDSIYHLFGNYLENFLDCKIL